MNKLQELRIHAEALSFAVEQDPKFFASVIQYVQRLKEISAFPTAETTSRELTLLANKLDSFWQQWASTREYSGPRQTEDTKETVEDIFGLVRQLAALSPADFLALVSQPSKDPSRPAGTAVFIGHGRNRLWARVQVFLQGELGQRVVTYESETRVGESIVPVLESMLSQANFAVLVLTAEDETADGGRRARQNVIHEAGLFQGRLGFRRAVLLIQHGVEEFTNVAGLQHIPFSGDHVEQTFYELQRVLKREGLV